MLRPSVTWKHGLLPRRSGSVYAQRFASTGRDRPAGRGLSGGSDVMPDLPKRTLGRTGLEVTTLGYGAMELRGAPRGRDVSEEQAERILNAVLDAGINFIDTSIDYGVAEERIGRYISHRRSEYFLASKCGCLAGDLATTRRRHARASASRTSSPPRTSSRASSRACARMKTDYLDLVQFHALALEGASSRSTAAWRRCRTSSGRARCASSASPGTIPNLQRADRDGRVRRLPDPVLGAGARRTRR